MFCDHITNMYSPIFLKFSKIHLDKIEMFHYQTGLSQNQHQKGTEISTVKNLI